MISWDDFEKVEMRVGTIIDAQDFPEAKKPALQLKINFGSSAKTGTRSKKWL